MAVLALSAQVAAQSARIVLRWKEVPGARGYELQIAKDPTFVEVVLQTQSTTAGYRWEELPAAAHWYRVRSFDAEGRPSEWSPARTITVDSAPPALLKPEDGAVLPCGGPVSFELGSNPVVKDYVLELSTTQDFAQPRVVTQSAPNFSVKDLAPGTWWWRSKAIDVKGRAAGPGPSRSLQVRLLAPKPKGLAEVTLGTPQVTFTWSPVACAARWVVEAIHDGQEPVSIPTSQPTLAFKTGAAGVYRWKVAAVDEAGRNGEFSAEQILKVKVPAPDGKSEALEGRKAELTWSAIPLAAGYKVELFLEAAEGAPLASANVTGTSWSTPELEPGRYAWQVTARDAAGHTSSPSVVRTFERVAPVVLQAPILESPLEHQAIDERVELEVRWVAVAGADRFELALDEGVPRSLTAQSAGAGTLSPGLHRVRLRAVGRAGVSPWTSVGFYVGVPPVAKAELALKGHQVRLTLLDEWGNPVERADPALRVSAGGLGPVTQQQGQWVADWAPPPEGIATLTVEERAFREEWPLARGEAGPLLLGAFAGGVFNGGAVASPTATLSLGYRLPVLQRRLTVELRAGLFAASSEVPVGGAQVTGSAWLFPVSALVGWHQPLGAFTVRGALGAGVQVGSFVVDTAQLTQVAPALELVAGLGRLLGPGRLEVEVGFGYARFQGETLRLNGGGVAVRVGYAVDLLGGR